MVESAAMLVDEVLPTVPLRQWVLSVPYSLRFLFAINPTAMGEALSIRRGAQPSAVYDPTSRPIDQLPPRVTSPDIKPCCRVFGHRCLIVPIPKALSRGGMGGRKAVDSALSALVGEAISRVPPPVVAMMNFCVSRRPDP